MKIGILKEAAPERRVCLLPESVSTLAGMGVTMLVEHDAGSTAFASDSDYEAAGGKIVSRDDIYRDAGMIIQINPPSEAEIGKMKESQVLLAVLNPYFNPALVKALA